MRRLTAAQALECETADGGRCRCRCLGLYHGRDSVHTAEELAGLPDNDPHQVVPPGPKPPRRRRQKRLVGHQQLIDGGERELWA